MPLHLITLVNMVLPVAYSSHRMYSFGKKGTKQSQGFNTLTCTYDAFIAQVFNSISMTGSGLLTSTGKQTL